MAARSEFKFTDGESFHLNTAMSGDDARVLAWMADVHDLVERHRVAPPAPAVATDLKGNLFSRCSYWTKVPRPLWEEAVGNGQSAIILEIVRECLQDMLALFGDPSIIDTDEPATIVLRWETALRFGHSPEPIEDRAK